MIVAPVKTPHPGQTVTWRDQSGARFEGTLIDAMAHFREAYPDEEIKIHLTKETLQ